MKAQKTCKRRWAKVRNYFLVNICTLSIVIQNLKNWVTRLFFKLEAFNCKVSFYRPTLTTVIVILLLKFEVKCCG